MARDRHEIGRGILNLLEPKKITLATGKIGRPLHSNFDERAIKELSKEHLAAWNADVAQWNKTLDVHFSVDPKHGMLNKEQREAIIERKREAWAEQVLNDELFPVYFENVLKQGLNRLYEILRKIPKDKKPNFFLFPATGSPVLLHAIKPILEKLGLSSPFYAFPRTNRVTYISELDEEDKWQRESLSGKKPKQSARERFLTIPQRPNWLDYIGREDEYRKLENAYRDKRNTIEIYKDARQDVLTDLSRSQLDHQTTIELEAWQKLSGLSLDNCRPFIIDDFADAETTTRDLKRSLQRGGIKLKNFAGVFAFMAYEMPDKGVTRDLFGQERTHIGVATGSDYSFPFLHPFIYDSELPPLTGTIKRRIANGQDETAIVNVNNLQQPWQESILPYLSENARKNQAALMRALRRRLRRIGEQVAQSL